ncbi:MAG TPA: P-loop NTPase fold protein [Cyclobacteriaceae bacterium]|nr:P-loop NTPase fold protein [Cyclobacteriaceae bacterium]
MASETNKHIREYLNYYLSLNTSPEFAVLLRGSWGSGKSWFIKDYLSQYAKDEYLYVSLYGVTSFTEIEDAFFQQLHPILSSKGMKIAGKVLKGLAKATIKIDWDGDGKENGSLSPSLPDFGIPDFLKKSDSRYLIFDDLERCSLPIQNILGYINQFVEMGGQKVILIANEQEIIKTDSLNKNDDDTKKYLTIKEKLIGKSFDIETDLNAALNNFIENVSTVECRTLLKSQDSLLIELFELAGYKNLRHLRQSIMDFDRFFSFLEATARKSDDLLRHLINLFFVISFELKKGMIEEDEIINLFDFGYFKGEDNDKSPVTIIRKKYPVFQNYYQPVPGDLFMELFKTGTIDRNKLKIALDNSTYLAQDKTPKWIKLWHNIDLEDDVFDLIYSAVVEDFNKLGAFNRYELLQVAGLLINLSQNELIPLTIPEIVQTAKDNFDQLKTNGGLQLNRYEDYPEQSSHGLGYQSINKPAFQEIVAYGLERIAESQQLDLPEKAVELLAILTVSIDQFAERITLNNSVMSIYFDVPILQYIAPENFVAAIVALPNKSKRAIGYYLEKRYNFNSRQELSEELPWLQQIRNLIKIEKERLQGKISGLLLGVTMASVDKCIATLTPEEG